MKTDKIKSLLKILLFVVAASWILHTFAKNFVVDPDFKKFLAEKAVQTSHAWWFWALRVHIVLALVALVAAPFGFVERLRKRRLGLHRVAGRIYVVSVLLNFVPSVYLAFYAAGSSRITAIGFLLLNLIWVGTTVQAYRTIRRKQVAAHRRWIIRSVAVTLANLQLYVLKTVFTRFAGFDFETAYAVAVWSCWIGGLVVAEIVIQKFAPQVNSRIADFKTERAFNANV